MLSIQPMRALEFIRDHVIFKLPYDFSYHMKTPLEVSVLNNYDIILASTPIDLLTPYINEQLDNYLVMQLDIHLVLFYKKLLYKKQYSNLSNFKK